MPTPNGFLHLGHIGSQFLNLDILHRHLKARGDQSLYLCGLDVFDNAISIEAKRTSKTEKTICYENYIGIERDLLTFSIEPNQIFNWKSIELSTVWEKALYKIHEKLSENVMLVGEELPFHTETNEPLIGRWFQGICPNCKKIFMDLVVILVDLIFFLRIFLNQNLLRVEQLLGIKSKMIL